MTLRFAAVIGALEGVVLVGNGVFELVSLDADRLALGLSTTLFFWLYGGGLLVAARALLRREAWARSPLVLAQLIQLGLAWNFRGEGTVAVAVALAVSAGFALVAVLHPSSRAALED